VSTASVRIPSFQTVESESHLAEVEKVLLYVSDARARAARARNELERSGAAEHLVSALREIEARLEEDHRRLMQSTFFAIPSDQDQLAV